MQRVTLLPALGLVLAACARSPAPQAEPLPASDTVDIVVAATTDVHGRLRRWDYFAGVPDSLHSLAAAATVVDSIRSANPGLTLLVDAGDLFQGNPLTYLAAAPSARAPHPVMAAMSVMRYDAAAVGNHEFNYGLPAFERAIAQATFPFLAANVFRTDGSRAFPAFVLAARGPLTVGIIGATTPGSAVWDRDKLSGVLEFRDIVPAVRTAVDSARAAGAHVIVVVMHSGLGEPASYDTSATGVPSENVAARVAHEVPGVDLIVFGHSHREVGDTTIAGVRLIQPRSWARSVAVATLTAARIPGGWRVVRSAGALVPTAGWREDSAVLAVTARAHARATAYAAESIGTTAVAWRADSARIADTPLIDFILEVQRSTTGAQLASTAAFSLEASLDSGPVTVAEVARLYPYENTLKAVRLTGRQLREYLEYSARYFGRFGSEEPAVNPRVPGFNFDIVAGAEYTIDVAQPVGSRITRLVVDGRPVADTDTFTMAVNNYRQSGGGGYAMLRDAPVVYDGTTEIRQLLIEEVRRAGTLRPERYFTRNWEIVPAEARASALRAMRRPFDAPPPASRAAPDASTPPPRPSDP
jgi:2',3'-cyclic-nucleotide 2'-phosphodiesterase (5'-nucleotidase family)